MNQAADPARALQLADALPLSPSPETAPVTIRPRYGHFIGGKFVDGREEGTFATVDPATGKELAKIAAADAGEVDKAVRSARAAYDKVWSKLPAGERGKYLYRIARRLQERSRELAVLESRDNGKPIRETRDVDVPLAAAHFFYYAGWADKLQYAIPGRSVRPVGVCGQIIPWNFPLLMAAWKLAPALATGNTCVLKPAETTPLTAMLLAEILQEVELPPGVVNIVNGAGATGAALVNHPGVDKVAFTGSTGVGRIIMKAVAGSRKKTTMELGRQRARTSSSPTPRSIRPSKAPSTASSSTRATSAARARGCSSKSPWRTTSSSASSAGSPPCASAIRSTRTPTSARSTARSNTPP
jgi:aldehyde dehydrogenase (NAD+)